MWKGACVLHGFEASLLGASWMAFVERSPWCVVGFVMNICLFGLVGRVCACAV